MILTASCILKASPGPIPGAPLKPPIVSLTNPNPGSVQVAPTTFVPQLALTDPGPEARLIRFRRLKVSMRNWILTRSVIGMFLNTERSTSPKPGPRRVFLARVGVPGPARANADGFHHCSPPAEAEN